MSRLNSRKFWIALIGAGIMVANDGLGLHLPADTLLAFAGIVISYLVAQGWVDGQEVKTGARAAPAAQGKDGSKDAGIVRIGILLLVLLIFTGVACCAKKISTPQDARALGYELSQRYEQLHVTYGVLHGSLPQPAQAAMEAKVAPLLDKAKHLLIIYNDAVIAWDLGGEPAPDTALTDIRNLLADVAAQLAAFGRGGAFTRYPPPGPSRGGNA